MRFLLGKKLNMTQIFNDKGERVSATVIQAGPCVVTQVRTVDNDGYHAVQIGFGKKKKLTKALSGHLKGLEPFCFLREFKLSEDDVVKRGDEIDVRVFKVGDKVKLSSISKGKGFQGVVKRHGFHGASKTHGTKDQVRMPGSIGATAPQRVFKGKRMGGRMGGDKITVSGLEVLAIDYPGNFLTVKGAVPGARGALVMIQASGKFLMPEEEKQEKKQEV